MRNVSYDPQGLFLVVANDILMQRSNAAVLEMTSPNACLKIGKVVVDCSYFLERVGTGRAGLTTINHLIKIPDRAS